MVYSTTIVVQPYHKYHFPSLGIAKKNLSTINHYELIISIMAILQ